METEKNATFYKDLNIRFDIEGAAFYALKLSYERFLRSIPSHSHSSNSYEIHYIPQGLGHITLEGRAYDVVPNTLYVTGPFVEHSQIPDRENPMAEYCVYLRTDERAPGHGRPLPPLAAQFTGTPYWLGQDSQGIHTQMQSIFTEMANRYTGYSTQVQALLAQLLVGVVRNYRDNGASTARLARANRLDSSYLLIEECFLYGYRDLTLDQLATRLGLSPRQTERLLARHYGKTFLQKKTEARMSAASILLQDAQNSIADVAGMLGYSSPEHFAHAFRQYYRMSAGQYRKTLIR